MQSVGKFYAVRTGRQPGIYRSWNACKAQVTGYKGAVYKSFSSQADAEDFITPTTLPSATPLPSTTPLPSSSLIIYTDGSHFKTPGKTGGHLGAGGYCKWRGKEYSFSRPITSAILQRYNITSEVSNPTAEFIAFAETLSYFTNQPITIPITFYIDYVGVAAWMNGDWNAKEPYIISLRDTCLHLLEQIPAPVTIKYVASKSDEGNLAADRLAKSPVETDNFPELIATLCE